MKYEDIEVKLADLKKRRKQLVKEGKMDPVWSMNMWLVTALCYLSIGVGIAVMWIGFKIIEGLLL
jgi:hypothetical protein